jgi:hypothetical protein
MEEEATISRTSICPPDRKQGAYFGSESLFLKKLASPTPNLDISGRTPPNLNKYLNCIRKKEKWDKTN